MPIPDVYLREIEEKRQARTPRSWTCEWQKGDDREFAGDNSYWAIHDAATYEFIANVYSNADDAGKIAAVPRLLEALQELLAAGDAMLAFLLTARPEVLGEAEWDRQHKARSERQRNAVAAAHAVLDSGRPVPPHGSGPATDSRRG